MKRTFVIAEMACSHEGSLVLAKKIIDSSIEAGADAIQFQIWRHQDLVVPDHPDITVLRKIELSFEQWQELYEYVRNNSNGMEVIACVYDAVSADFANSLGVDAFKIHTSDVSNPALIKKVAAYRKRIDLSVGASTYSEIAKAIAWIREVSDSGVWLMYGKQLFPTEVKDAAIQQAVTLGKAFGLPVGYQDHTDADLAEAFWVPIAAVGAGLLIQEKHVTHDRSLRGVDHQAALNPDEFKKFVSAIRNVETALGDGFVQEFSDAEKKYRIYSKKSLVAAKGLGAGHVLSEGDLIPLRAQSIGYPPEKLDHLLGKVLKSTLAPFEVLTDEALL